jgi:hypothetical protein
VSAGVADKGQDEWQAKLFGKSKRDILQQIVLPIVLSANSVTKIAVDYGERLKVARQNCPGL